MPNFLGQPLSRRLLFTFYQIRFLKDKYKDKDKDKVKDKDSIVFYYLVYGNILGPLWRQYELSNNDDGRKYISIKLTLTQNAFVVCIFTLLGCYTSEKENLS